MHSAHLKGQFRGLEQSTQSAHIVVSGSYHLALGNSFRRPLDIPSRSEQLSQTIPFEPKKPRGRSRVSNNSSLFVVADARSVWGRRYGDLFRAFVTDLGGVDRLSEGRVQLCRRAASLALEAERIEGQLAEGKEADVDQLGRLTGHLGRVLDRLGLEKVARDIGPRDIDEYARMVNEGRT